MYSSATRSSSASGLSGGALFVGFGEGEGEGEGEVAEVGEEEGEGEDFGLEGLDGFSEGEGDALWRGLTGPVGRSGGAGLAVGVGEGDGAAARNPTPGQPRSTKMNGRHIIARRA